MSQGTSTEVSRAPPSQDGFGLGCTRRGPRAWSSTRAHCACARVTSSGAKCAAIWVWRRGPSEACLRFRVGGSPSNWSRVWARLSGWLQTTPTR
eukprot:scaffold2882_cov434-Prasinococcus_capsulatus_cf.AAC.8